MCGRAWQPDVEMNSINIRSNMHRPAQIHHFWQNMAGVPLGTEMTLSFTMSVRSNSVCNLPFDAKALLRTPSPTVQTAAELAFQSRYFLRSGIEPKWRDRFLDHDLFLNPCQRLEKVEGEDNWPFINSLKMSSISLRRAIRHRATENSLLLPHSHYESRVWFASKYCRVLTRYQRSVLMT
jgi:hypothetical protein